MAQNNTRKSRRLFSAGSLFSAEVREKLLKTNLIWYWIGFAVLSAVILLLTSVGSSRSYEAGDIASQSLIYEGATFTYTSDVAYEKAVAEVEAAVNDVYILDKTKLEALNDALDQFLNDMSEIKAIEDHDSEEAVSLYHDIFGDGDDAAVYESALNSVSLEAIATVTASVRSYLSASYADGVKDSDLENYVAELNEWIDESDYSDDEKVVGHAVISTLDIEANYILDEEETAAITAKRVAEIQPEEVTLRSGEKIVDEGTEITAEQLEALQKAGMLTEGKGIAYFFGVLLYVFFLYLLLFVYCKRYFPLYAYEREGILMVGLVIIVFLLLCQGIMLMVSSATGTLHSVLGFLLPLPAVAMIFSTLTNQRVAFITTTFAGLMMFVLVLSQPLYLIVAAVASLFTLYTVGRIRERYQLVSFGLYLGLVNFLMILVLALIGEQSPRTALIGGAVGFISGLLSSLIALGAIPLLENTLKLATPMKLMELSSTGHPLIKRLMAEAPGTYYHSILVANLAESAADAIGADPLLTRVASYYHDIGKLERPAYFTENQEGGTNPHDKLTPAMSTLILVSHVKDGVEMVREYGLPDVVVNIIAEHHGSSVVKYFYHKAKENGDDVTEEEFSYPFPKPQTRESALVMMADTVQAALQSMPPMSKREMAAKIHGLITDKLEEGQFEECDLTFRDLHVIQDAFVAVYDGMTHHRIRYPDLKALAKKSGIKMVSKMAEKDGVHDDDREKGAEGEEKEAARIES